MASLRHEIGSRARGSALAHAAAIVAIGSAAYSNSFSVPFQFDDGNSIVENASVRDLPTFLSQPIRPARAVAYFTFALNGSLGGTSSPRGYHALNLAIHLAAALVLYALARLVCRAVAPDGTALQREAPLAALVAAALFVAHPLQTQAVTYIVQRMASLLALLYLATVLAYARAALEPDRARRGGWYAAALVLATLAMFTKENAVTIPAALAVLDLCVLQGTARRRVTRLLPFLALTAVAVFALAPRAAIQATAADFKVVARAADVPPWVSYGLTQPSVVLAYLRLLAVPVGQSVDHDPVVHASLSAPVLLSMGALAMVLAVPGYLGWRARSSPGGRIALLAVGWFLVTMAVESSVVPIPDAMVEHRMYLPSAGIFLAAGIAIASTLDRADARRRSVAAAAVAAWVAGLAVATYARNEVWRDPMTLWTDAMTKAPARSRPAIFVAQALIGRGDPERAIPLLQGATRLRPRTSLPELNLGRAYGKMGRLPEAERAFRDGIALDGGTTPGAYLELGNVLRDQGRVEEACGAYRAELGPSPGSREARSNLVVCALARGDAAAAAAAADQLVQEDPRDARMLFNLGFASATAGDVPRATDVYRRFLSAAGPDLAPQVAVARQWLAQHGAKR